MLLLSQNGLNFRLGPLYKLFKYTCISSFALRCIYKGFVNQINFLKDPLKFQLHVFEQEMVGVKCYPVPFILCDLCSYKV